MVIGDSVLISASYGRGSALLDLDEQLRPIPRWTTEEFGLHFHTAAVRDGHAYGFEGRNEPDASFACLDLATGEVLWREWPLWDETFRRGRSEFVRPAGYYRAQLLAADGAHLCLGELGQDVDAVRRE